MMSTKKRFVHAENFLSNLDKRDKRVLVVAARNTDTKIYFEDKAFDGNSLPMKELIGVYTCDVNQDHSDMWIEYGRINYEARRGNFSKVMGAVRKK